MARKRMIDPSFWSDEKVARLSFAGRLTFIALWTFAEDTGVGRGDPRLLKSQIFPYDSMTTEQFKQILCEIAASGMIRLYRVEEQHYYKVVNFKKHQKISRPTPAKLPDIASGDQKVIEIDSVRTHGGLIEDSCAIEENIKEKNIIKSNIRERKEPYGSRKNIFLSPGEYEELCKRLGKERTDQLIEKMSLYMAAKGVRYEDHEAALLKWAGHSFDAPPAAEPSRDALGAYELAAIEQMGDLL